ncbi:MAG TPA: GyrI-like domain-containing protein [Nonomuraea sp.]|uniref:GyrI-like domain-containing protein n=1 Tax=Nonomuraea sp. NPDC049649 TaxID=3155776 RepID=UPI002CFBDCF8|nr:GyrI-like domain-containing protein [Nonomuraea sp.]
MPQVIELPERHYVGIRRTITMTTFGLVADRLGEIFAWLGERGTPPAGSPFFRFHVIDMQGDLQVEAGVPVAAPMEGEGDIVPGVIPAGRYAVATHVGHPDQLIGAIHALRGWAAEQGLAFDMTDEPDGEHWGCRLEIYHTNPEEQPDMRKWETELQFRLA